MTEREVAIVLARLGAAFPHTTVDSGLAMTWAKQFASVPAEEAMVVAETIIRQSKFFPSIAEFRETWMVGLKSHRFRNPYELSADHLYPRLEPDELRERIGVVKADLADHPLVPPPPRPAKAERPKGPPPTPCTEGDHRWCLADAAERERLAAELGKTAPSDLPAKIGEVS